METPSVDIITPTLNRAHSLPAAWESLRSQTEQHFHWIIVDGDSTDGTADVVRNFNDPRVTFINAPGSGVNAARTRGEQEVRSSYVVFFDSDDELYDDDTLRFMLDAIESAPEEVGCVGFPAVDAEGRELFSFLEQDRLLLTYEDIVCEKKAKGEFTFIFKRKALDVAPWPECNGMEVLRHWAIAKQYPSLLIRRPVRIYHKGGEDNLTSAPQAIARAGEMARVMSQFIDEYREAWLASCGQQYGHYLFYAGMYHALAGQRGSAFKRGVASLQAHGPAIKNIVLLGSLFLPVSLRRKLFSWRANR